MSFDTEICYTCLKKAKSKLLTEKDTDDITYEDKLDACIPGLIKILEMAMCNQCIDNLRTTYTFKETVLKSQEMWNDFLETTRRISEVNVWATLGDEPEVENSDSILQENLEIPDIVDNSEDTEGQENIPSIAHSINLTRKRKFFCVSCGKHFKTLKGLNRHFLMHSSFNNFECRQCDKQFLQFRHLSTHMCVHGRKPFSCDCCGKTFAHKFLLTRHRKIHQKSLLLAEIREFGCLECDKKYKSQRSLNRHIKSHNNSLDSKLSCPFCGRNFKLEYNFKKHLRLHINDGATTSTADQIYSLINQIEKKSSTKYKCESCWRTFNHLWRLNRHIREFHKNERKYKCSRCDMSFKQSGHLKDHLTIHTGEMRYSCSICDKKFQRSNSYRRHVKRHSIVGLKTPLTPYLCPICGKRFPYSNGFQRHMRTHTNEKNYTCEFCGRKFGQSTHLNVHVRLHTGEKPYVCEVCGEAFPIKISMIRHMKVHSEDDPHILKIQLTN